MISLIVAYSKNRVIGRAGRIPWDIPGEKRRFKELTTGNVVIMGRKTYEEIGHPLPDRDTIVVSSTVEFNEEHCRSARSLAEALKMAEGRDIYVSGGERLYKEAIPIAEKMYITEIDIEVEGDTFFPQFDESNYKKEIIKKFNGEIPYAYVTYTLTGRQI